MSDQLTRQLDRAIEIGDHAAEVMLRARMTPHKPCTSADCEREALPGWAYCDSCRTRIVLGARLGRRFRVLPPVTELEMRFLDGDR